VSEGDLEFKKLRCGASTSPHVSGTISGSTGRLKLFHEETLHCFSIAKSPARLDDLIFGFGGKIPDGSNPNNAL
jgi:hypothetical protein